MMSVKFFLFLLVACLSLAATAGAQVLSGSISGEVIQSEPFGSATSSSLRLFPTNVIQSVSGDFSGIVLPNSLLLNNFETINNLSTTPLTDPIDDYFQFSAADTYPGMSASGTTPADRFYFNLDTITETSYSGNGIGDFSGTGTLFDITSTYSSSPADFTIDFTSAGNYSFTIETVPEPATIALFSAGSLALLVFLRRRAFCC